MNRYPVVRYVIQRGDRFVADDRHSDYDPDRTEPLASPFVCEWDTPEQAPRDILALVAEVRRLNEEAK